MAEENEIETPKTPEAPPPEAEAAAEPAAEATEAAAPEEAEKTSGEMVFCAVSKQMVPIEETVEVERKKGEVLRIHKRFKKFE